LTRTFENVPQHENVVAQLYIKKPLLLDNFKFDLRICKCQLGKAFEPEVFMVYPFLFFRLLGCICEAAENVFIP
jgi:hypothetical protein